MRDFSVDEVGRFLSSGFWQGAGTPWIPPDMYYPAWVDISTLSPANAMLARLAMMAWSELGYEFETGAGYYADMILTDDEMGAMTYGDYTGIIVNVGPDFTAQNGSAFGSYTYQSWLHELGHALGLGHTGFYNGTGTYGEDNLFRNDSWQMSVMSYFAQDENTSIKASFAFVLTPMPGDIAAVEQMHGEITSAQLGNTTYFWKTNADGIHGVIGRSISNGSLDTPFTLTLVDRGGVDTLNFSGEREGVRFDLRPGQIGSAFGLNRNIVIERKTVIENVIGSSDDDRIAGQGARNRLTGRAGDDWLDGRANNDTLIGGAGDDVLIGGSGDDVLRGGAGVDRLIGGKGFDTLVLGNGANVLDLVRRAVNTGEARGDWISGIEGVKGGNRDDRLSGNHVDNELIGQGGDDRLVGRGGDDTLDGGVGRDTLVGGSGDDVLIGGAGADQLLGLKGFDTVVYGNAPTVVDMNNPGASTRDAAGDRLRGVEAVQMGNGSDKVYGNGRSNKLEGNGGHDLLDGRGGHDTLLGGLGNDTLLGGAGNDTLHGGNGADVLDGGIGTNLLTGGAGADSFVFRGHRTEVADFTPGDDLLLLDADRLGLAGMDAEDIAAMAEISGGGLILDFDNGAVLRLDGITSIYEIEDHIVLI